VRTSCTRRLTFFDVRDYVEAGRLASYGADYYNVTELIGGYVARVPKGEKVGRFAGSANGQVRDGVQPQHGSSARGRDISRAVCYCG
jgi:hypothetical protein